MNGNRTRYALMILMAALLTLSGCTKFNKIRPVSANIEGIEMSGLRSAVLTIGVEVDNPASRIALSEIEGVINHSGKVFGRVAVDPFILEARSLEKYHLRAVLTLDGNVSLFDVMGLFKGNAVEDITVDVYARAKLKGGASKRFSYEDVPLKELYDLTRQ